ncbi:MAG TPA: hypothetical protein VLC46_13370 [Thermoanaerobaculia bacterium]|jgi:hypothetical protein|nr:hypothetical protein [Thermoanaerobaculia bacterium]
MRTVLMLTTLLVVFGCATNGGAPGPEPAVAFIQLSRVAEGTQYDTGPISTQFAVEVKNTLPETLQLRRVSVQSIGGGSYTLGPYSQGFNETIGPGETKRVSFWAPARVVMATVAGANGPVTLRGTLDFDSAGKKFQKVVVQNVEPEGGN